MKWDFYAMHRCFAFIVTLLVFYHVVVMNEIILSFS